MINAANSVTDILSLLPYLLGILLLMAIDFICRKLFRVSFPEYVFRGIWHVFRCSIMEFIELIRKIGDLDDKTFRAGFCGLIVIVPLIFIVPLVYRTFIEVFAARTDWGEVMSPIVISLFLVIFAIVGSWANHRFVCPE